MQSLQEYFEKNEANVTETLTFDLSGKLAVNELKKAIAEYMERHHYSEFKFYFGTNEWTTITLKSNGYEEAINLYCEDEYIDSVDDAEDAFNKIEKIVIDILNKEEKP